MAEWGRPDSAGRLAPWPVRHGQDTIFPEGGGHSVEHPGNVVRVLVVDDQALFRRAITAVVEETVRFDVVGNVDTGEAAVAAVDALRPDLVLMDVNLPGIDGLEATRRVRARDQAPVVLLLSTYDEEVGQGFVAESGAAAYLTKAGFGPDVLEQAWERERRRDR